MLLNTRLLLGPQPTNSFVRTVSCPVAHHPNFLHHSEQTQKMPLSVLISDGDASKAFHHQFSTIIRLESCLHGDHSEDITGPARQRWAVRHLTEVARAQGFTSQLPTHAQGTTLNVHAPDFITPPPAYSTRLNVHAREFITPPPTQATTSNHSERIAPWYENFNLADQGVSFGPYYPQPSTIPFNNLSRTPSPYNPLNPAELAGYRAAVRAQLFQSSDQRAESQHSLSNDHLDHKPDLFSHPSHNFLRGARLPSTPPNNFSRVRYPSTPHNRSARRPHQISPTDSDSLPDLFTNNTQRSNTEPIAQSASMGSLTAPDHYKHITVYAVDVQNGDYIQSVKNPGT